MRLKLNGYLIGDNLSCLFLATYLLVFDVVEFVLDVIKSLYYDIKYQI